MIEQKPALNNATIGIITALPLELAAVCNSLGCVHKTTVAGRTYRMGVLPRRDNDGAHAIAVLCLRDMGNSSAAAATMQLFADCRNIYYVLMCGIAGAVPNPGKPSDHCRLGDIVVPDQRGVVLYDHESVREWGVETRSRSYNPCPDLLDAAHQLAADERLGIRPWNGYITEALTSLGRQGADVRRHWERPPADTDILAEFSSRRPGDYLIRALRRIGLRRLNYAPIPHPDDKERLDSAPRIFHGVIASANRLQRNSENRDALAKKFGAVAIDMESGGVADAAYQRGIGFYVARATSDYCNEEKAKGWQPYAACAAAAYLRALLEIAPQAPLSGTRGGPERVDVAMENIAVKINPADQGSQKLVPLIPESSQLEWNQAMAEVLTQQVRDGLAEIRRCLDIWEFSRAAQVADRQAAWLEQVEKQVPKELLQECYTTLAQVEIASARQAQQRGDLPDLTRAQRYLAKAKNVLL